MKHVDPLYVYYSSINVRYYSAMISTILQDKVQVTMLVTWLVEIWLNQLGKAADMTESDGNKLSQDREIMQEEFRLFLANSNIRVRHAA